MLIYEFYDVLIEGSVLCYTISTNSTQDTLGDGLTNIYSKEILPLQCNKLERFYFEKKIFKSDGAKKLRCPNFHF